MSAAKKGLGRGFESLIPTDLLDESFDPTASQDDKVSELRHIRLSDISADPTQPRRHFDEFAIDELASSIMQHGVLQPIVVTPKDGAYQIVAGERRYRAAKRAKLEKIPALVRTLSDQHKLEISLIENIQRRDLNPIETATAYLKLRDQFNLTLDEIGHRVGGKSISAVSNTMRLLKLPDNVKKALFERKISEGQARPLIGLDEQLIDAVLPKIIQEEWSTRKIEQFIVQLKNGEAGVAAKRPPVDTSPYEEDTARLMKKLSTDVKVRTNAKGAGQIVIKFKNEDEFRRLQNLLENEQR